jgi:hypothetical protein
MRAITPKEESACFYHKNNVNKVKCRLHKPHEILQWNMNYLPFRNTLFQLQYLVWFVLLNLLLFL